MWGAQSPQQLSWGSRDRQCHAKGQLQSKMHRHRNKTDRKTLKTSVLAYPSAAPHTLDCWQESGAIPADIRSSFTLWTAMDLSLGLVNQGITGLVTLSCRKGRFSASLSRISTWCSFKKTVLWRERVFCSLTASGIPLQPQQGQEATLLPRHGLPICWG